MYTHSNFAPHNWGSMKLQLFWTAWGFYLHCNHIHFLHSKPTAGTTAPTATFLGRIGHALDAEWLGLYSPALFTSQHILSHPAPLFPHLKIGTKGHCEEQMAPSYQMHLLQMLRCIPCPTNLKCPLPLIQHTILFLQHIPLSEILVC